MTLVPSRIVPSRITMVGHDASAAAVRDTSRRDPGHASLVAVDDASAAARRVCTWCERPIPDRARRDAKTCSKSCRQASHRARVRRLEADTTDRPLRLAYADPPYPGNAWRYRSHPDFAGEVDHRELLSRLARYDGWALSTSAAALPMVVAECVAQDLTIRIASWHRGAAPHATARIRNGWEPVVYSGGRRIEGPRVVDAIAVVPRRRPTLPTAVLGMKPPAFCIWMFGLLGALPGDSLDDLYPGSGIVGRCWDQYVAPAGGRDASCASTDDASRLVARVG